ncbi:MAG: immunoglobulin-like domain-containing protein, partial [Candidatus Woesearchaeota archaeon]
FDGGVGNALFDYSGNNNNAVSEGTLTIVNDGVSGNAISFNGISNERINVSSIDITPNYVFTVSMWFKNAYPNVVGGMMEKGGTFYADCAFMLISIDGRVDFKLCNGTGEVPLDTGYKSTNDTNWHNIVAGYNGTTGFLYLDGIFRPQDRDQDNFTGRPASGLGTVYIGKIPSYDVGIFNGSIDEVRIYNYVLSYEQILALYENVRNEKIVFNQLNTDDTWQCRVTGFDLANAGPTYLSNSLIISENRTSENNTNTTTPDTTRPIVKINGLANVTIKVNSTYIELGANATDNIDGKINVTISGFVNTSAIGNYIITYRARDLAGNNGSKIRNVSVVPLTRKCALNDTETIDSDTDELYINQSSFNLTKIFISKDIDDYKEINLILTDLKDENSSVYLLNNLTLNRESSSNLANHTIYIPSDTIITGGSNWDGKFSLPTIKHSENYNVNGVTPSFAINLGKEDYGLNFSNPIRIVMGNESGHNAAFGIGTTLNDISTVCDNETYPTNINITNTRECYINSGNDLVIWSFHLTTFAAYTPVVPPQVSSGNSGSHSKSGKSAISYTSNTTPTQNETINEEITNTPLRPIKKPNIPSAMSEDITRVSNDNTNQDANVNNIDTTINPSSKESNLVTGNSISNTKKPNWLFAIMVSAFVVIVSAYFLFSIQKKE